MSESSPPKPEESDGDGARNVALGGMRRVFNSRQKSRDKSRITAGKATVGPNDEESDADSQDENDGRVVPLTRNTSNHYTLNYPSSPAPQSEMPYILMGQVLSHSVYYYEPTLTLLK